MKMEITTEFLTDELTKRGIRASYQRIRVLACLYQKDAHPTVEDIFQALSPEIPSLSKATIYNTLHTFIDAGMVRIVGIDDTETRYDIMLYNHGHFKCEACGAISNFEIPIDDVPVTGLKEYEIKEKNVYFKGLCPSCLNKLKSKKGD